MEGDTLESIAIYRVDKVIMLNLLADYEKKIGHRTGFAKFQKVLLASYVKQLKEDGRHERDDRKNRTVRGLSGQGKA